MFATRTILLAHQGGWDEYLYVLVPIVVIVMLLRVAGKRAKKIDRRGLPDSVNPPD